MRPRSWPTPVARPTLCCGQSGAWPRSPTSRTAGSANSGHPCWPSSGVRLINRAGLCRLPDMAFRGWPMEALDFFEGLEADNSKTYWTEHRATYDEQVLAPMVEL